MKKESIKKNKKSLLLVLPILLVIFSIGLFAITKNGVEDSKKNSNLSEKLATGYMADQIETLKNEDDENLISDRYLVTENYIKRIKENTEIKEFKEAFQRNIKVYEDDVANEEKNEGIITTGMIAKDGENTYTLIVDGDVSNDGNVNQLDITRIIRNELDGQGSIEASEFGVEKVTEKIVYGNYELPKVPVVASPEINIISGEIGKNDWYTSDVTIKILPRDDKATKTVYKIKGTKTQEETIVNLNDEITLSTDGVYKIIAYTYGEEGNKSKISSQIIKVNKTGIEATITYSTKEETTEPVIATITFNKDGITILNNDGKNTYEFTDNGEFTFEYVDEAGRTGSITAKVDWIKKKEVVGNDGEWKYFVRNDNTIQLTQYLGSKTELVVPANYDGYIVYAIGRQGLSVNTPSSERLNIFGTSSNSSVTKLTFEEGIKEIKIGAFNKCSGLKGDLVIPEGVTLIDMTAFNLCTGLDGTLTLPSTLKTIGKAAFQGCSKFNGNLKIPNGVDFIDDYAFNQCLGFSGDLVIPNSVESIGSYAFSMCTGLNGNLTLSSSLKNIKDGAFNKCSGFIGDLVIPNSVENIGSYAFSTCTGLNGNLTLSSSLKNIEDGAFNKCSGFIGDLVIPDSVENIGRGVFQYCSGFDGELKLSSNLKNIDAGAFSKCTNLKGTLEFYDGLTNIGEQAFRSCGNLTGDLIIPDTVTSMGSAAFYECGKLDGSIKISSNLQTIPSYAFYNCSNLKGGLDIPNSVKEIGPFAFNYCKNLDGKITLSNSLKYIGKAAFQMCEKLKGEINLPEGLEYIGNFAFSKCKNFENISIIIPSTLSKIGEDYSLDGENIGIGSHVFYNFGATNECFEKFEVAEGNENFVAVDGVLYTKDKKRLVCYPRNKKDVQYEIIEGTELLDQLSIASNMQFKTLIIPDSLVIARKDYPDFTTTNEHPLIYSLYDYNAVEDIIAKDTNPNYKSNDGVLYTKDMKQLVYISSGRTKEVIIPDGVETINEQAIYSSQVGRRVNKLYIPATVTNISDTAIKEVNNGFIKKIEISSDNPVFTLDASGKLIKKQ